MPGIAECLPILAHLMLTITARARYYYCSPVIDEEIETKKHEEACSGRSVWLRGLKSACCADGRT